MTKGSDNVKYYDLYMDRQRISRETHERLLALTAPRHRAVPRWATGAAALAACCAFALFAGFLDGLNDGGTLFLESFEFFFQLLVSLYGNRRAHGRYLQKK